MGTKARHERLEPLIEEFNALSDTIWSPASKKKHAADFGRFLAWLVKTGRPPTTESLELPTLLVYVKHLLTKPPVRGVWRGDPEAVSKALQGARPGDSLSKNTVHSYMSPLRTLCSHLRKEGILAIDPFLKARQRGGDGNPLLPKERTLPKGASLDDFAALEGGAAGRKPLDLRDQAIIVLMKTTTARNSSVRLLRKTDIDFSQNLVTFRRAKGDNTYAVALHPEAKAALIRYLNRGRPKLLPPYPVRGYEDLRLATDPGWVFLARDNGQRSERVGPLTANGLSQMLDDRYHKGKGALASFRSHRIRHGAATALANNGMPIEELSRFMGHSSVVPTLIYAPQSPAALGQLAAEAMARAGLSGNQRARRAR